MRRNSSIATKLASLVVASTWLGCASDPGVESTESEIEQAQTTSHDDAPPNRAELHAAESSKGCAVRADFAGGRSITTGPFGSWGDNCYSFCPVDYFAYAINLRTEAPQGSGDDSAVNAISLHCYHKTTGFGPTYVTDQAGGWGVWANTAQVSPNVTGNPISGAVAKVEWSQQSGDDTALNGVAFSDLDNDNDIFYPQRLSDWGDWSSDFNEATHIVPDNKKCWPGSAVCGIMTRLEAPQGSNDDTKLNGFVLACCDFP